MSYINPQAHQVLLSQAFTLLNKRLKPLEHFQPTPTEFKDLCYLLSAKSVHDAPSFKNWEGVASARERLVEAFGQMVEGEREEEKEGALRRHADELMNRADSRLDGY